MGSNPILSATPCSCSRNFRSRSRRCGYGHYRSHRGGTDSIPSAVWRTDLSGVPGPFGRRRLLLCPPFQSLTIMSHAGHWVTFPRLHELLQYIIYFNLLSTFVRVTAGAQVGGKKASRRRRVPT